jgi:transcription elongation factor Elf1
LPKNITPEKEIKMNKPFNCQKCGKHQLEEVMIGVLVYSKINEVNCGEEGDPADVVYGEQSHEDGEVIRYQCMDCGETLQFDEMDIETPEDLNDWILCHQ